MSARTAVLHPLALSSICDHYTRVKSNLVGGDEDESMIVGILIGVPDHGSNSISIRDSNDILFPGSSSSSVDNKNGDDSLSVEEQIKRKLYLIQQIFPTYIFIGAYFVSEDPNIFATSVQVLQEFKKLCESPILA